MLPTPLEDKAQTLRNPLYRISSRYRHFAEYERRFRLLAYD